MIEFLKDMFIGSQKCDGYETRHDMNGNPYYKDYTSTHTSIREK